MKTTPLTLLYDGQCSLCRREMEWLRRRNYRESIVFIDISDKDFCAGHYGTTQERLMARMHAVLADGSLVDGMEVFRRAYSAVGLGWLLAPTAWPVLKPLFDWLYSRFAKHRRRISKLFGRVCGSSCHYDIEA